MTINEALEKLKYLTEDEESDDEDNYDDDDEEVDDEVEDISSYTDMDEDRVRELIEFVNQNYYGDINEALKGEANKLKDKGEVVAYDDVNLDTYTYLCYIKKYKDHNLNFISRSVIDVPSDEVFNWSVLDCLLKGDKVDEGSWTEIECTNGKAPQLVYSSNASDIQQDGYDDDQCGGTDDYDYFIFAQTNGIDVEYTKKDEHKYYYPKFNE